MAEPKPTATLSLLSLNCYLLPGWFVNENNSTCVNQDVRAAKIGQLAAVYDLLTFQEVWGSNTDKIQANIAHSHTILPECQSWSVFGLGATLLDTARFYLNQNGGLYSAFRQHLPLVFSSRHTYTISETKSKKGAVASLINASAVWGQGRHILVVNTHLDPQDPTTQIPQLQQCTQFIRESLKRAAQEFKVLPSNTAVLITGDFNISATGSLYPKVVQTLGDVTDLYASVHGSDRVATYDATNTLNKWKENHRIDYVFALNSIDSSVPLLRIKAFSATVLKQKPGEELSDHWAQAFDLQLA